MTKFLPKSDKNTYTGSLWQSLEQNQVPFTRNLLALHYLLHAIVPALRPYTEKFVTLQYKIDQDRHGNDLYGIGIDDTYVVIYWIILFTFLRSFLMKYLWLPIASNFYHLKRSQSLRFAEQSWICYFAAFSFSFSWYIYSNSEYYNNIDNLFIDWPHDKLLFRDKFYYLMQIGFWLHSIFALNVEKKRKDYIQMFSHHIITSLLVIGSYYYYFIRIGNIILILMDPVDVFLAGAKVLRYIGYTTLCDIMFIIFLIVWVVSRHGFYNYIFYHAYVNAQRLSADSQCIPGVITERRCWTPNVYNYFYGLLGGLQIIALIWLYFILKIAYKVITGSNAEDVRSDSEDDEDDEDEQIDSVDQPTEIDIDNEKEDDEEFDYIEEVDEEDESPDIDENDDEVDVNKVLVDDNDPK